MIYFYMSRRTIARGWTDRHEMLAGTRNTHSTHTLARSGRSLSQLASNLSTQYSRAVNMGMYGEWVCE